MTTQSVVLQLLHADKCGEGNRCSYASFLCEHIKIRETFLYGSYKWASEKFGVPINKPMYDYSSCNCEIVEKQ
jgi:hypothetical protein